VAKLAHARIPAPGHPPDSLYHHVVGTTDAKTDAERDTVVEVVRPGYLLRGDVLRKADVIFAN
jgi:molecular chaperone GrpE (heat shock protein)